MPSKGVDWQCFTARTSVFSQPMTGNHGDGPSFLCVKKCVIIEIFTPKVVNVYLGKADDHIQKVTLERC